MATTQNIGGDGVLFVGEDKTFRYENLDGAELPVDMTGWSVLWDLRKSDNSRDPAILSKTLTISGVFNAVRASNLQRGFFTLTDTEMNTVKARTYRYSYKRMDDGSETVLARGDFAPEKATAP